MGLENASSMSDKPAATVAPSLGVLATILAWAKAAPVATITIRAANRPIS